MKEAEPLSRRLHHFNGHPSMAVFFSKGGALLCGMLRYRKVKLLEPVVAAYLAGLVDGEGTVTLTRQHRNEMRRLVVCISNNELEILEFARDKIGAGRITTKRTYSERHNDSFAYLITSRQALNFLEQIVPHMKSYKARRAALALKHYVRLTPRNGKYLPGIAKEREQFENQVLSTRPGKRVLAV